MKTKQLATKIDGSVKDALEAFCEERGIKMNRFIEDAILDKLEEFEDVGDLKRLRQVTIEKLAIDVCPAGDIGDISDRGHG